MSLLRLSFSACVQFRYLINLNHQWNNDDVITFRAKSSSLLINLLDNIFIVKCTNSQISLKSIKYTETIEHQGLETISGVIVHKALRYLKSRKQYNSENN